ncbi:MAG: acetamidase/formamidase family protein [Acidobacteria bacterium]|nr:acetamidase/formamidase family protein [Acidobacteriota bacterium]
MESGGAATSGTEYLNLFFGERAVKGIEIDRNKRLKDQPETGHNRWHPDVPPALEADPGEEVILQTRDALDGQFNRLTTESDFDKVKSGSIHPLTGPVFIKGAQAGDLLEVEFLEIAPEPWAYSAIVPGFGFLRDVFTSPFMVHWEIENDGATSPQLPGVRIPGGPFMGVSGVAPSHAQVSKWSRREEDLLRRGGIALAPDPDGAVPNAGLPAREGLRTLPPRENGGNLDIKQLTRGSRLLFPVSVEGALFSTGDGHFAQGDGEVCVTAIEMGATVAMRFRILKGEAQRHNIRSPRFSHHDYFSEPRWAVPRQFIATMGMPIREDGTNEGENLTLASRNAVLNMIDLLQERGWSREQAYVLCSVAVDLRVSNVVDVPNFVVSAFLPLEIFQA